MYGSVLLSTSAPCSTCWGGTPCVMSMISVSGAMVLITPWQVPTKSSWSPKSERKVITMGGSLPRPRGRRRPRDGFDQSVEVVRARLRDHPYSGQLGGACRLGTDRHRRESEA